MAMPPRPVETGGRETSDSLHLIKERLRAFRAAREWEQYHKPVNLAIAVSVESGELLELFQWKSDDEVEEARIQNPDAFADELADVAIYVIQLADALSIDLPDAIETKIARNATRYPVALSRGSHRKHSVLRAFERADTVREQ